MIAARQLVRFAASNSRQISRSAAVRQDNIPEGYKKLKEIQARFQVKDGKPVFLKGGTSDRLLYQATVLLCGVGIIMMGKLFFDLAVPKK